MNQFSDSQLLGLYARERSEPAFSALVGRHLDVVYGAALRQLAGDAEAARDVSQAVFCDLARKAGSLSKHPTIVGWLYTATRHRAISCRRSESRRRNREMSFHMN